jgi:hypothetical protein
MVLYFLLSSCSSWLQPSKSAHCRIYTKPCIDNLSCAVNSFSVKLSLYLAVREFRFRGLRAIP